MLTPVALRPALCPTASVRFGNRLKQAEQEAKLKKINAFSGLEATHALLVYLDLGPNYAFEVKATENRLKQVIEEGDRHTALILSGRIVERSLEYKGASPPYNPPLELVRAIEKSLDVEQYVDTTISSAERAKEAKTMAWYDIAKDSGGPMALAEYWVKDHDLMLGSHHGKANLLRCLEDKLMESIDIYSVTGLHLAIGAMRDALKGNNPKKIQPTPSLLSKLEAKLQMPEQYIDAQADALTRLDDMAAFRSFDLIKHSGQASLLARILVNNGGDLSSAHNNRENRIKMVEDIMLQVINESSLPEMQAHAAARILNQADYEPKNKALTDRLVELIQS